MLPNSTSGTAELGNVANGLSSETTQLLVGVAEDLNHGLETTQVGDGTSNVRILRDLLQDLQ